MTIDSHSVVWPTAGCCAPAFPADKVAPAISFNKLNIGLLWNDDNCDGWLRSDHHRLTGF